MAEIPIFNPQTSAALGGGALIGAAAALLMWTTGRTAGISGILGGLLPSRGSDVRWRLLFLLGLFAGGLALLGMMPELLRSDVPHSPLTIAIAGLLVGFGTRLGNGCTSGHGVCGLARLSPRSLAAVMTFMAAGAITALLARVFLGGHQ